MSGRPSALFVSGLLLVGSGAGGCAVSSDQPAERMPSEDRRLVIDAEAGWVRIHGIVPINASQRPMLEVLLCTPDTREHEALVLTTVRPSSVHAALLALGAEPGAPGGEVWNGKSFELREPSGPPVRVRLTRADRPDRWVDARSWFEPTRSKTAPGPSEIGWLFTGSTLDADGYSADADGVIVGLVSFGTGVIGISPASSEIDAKRGFDFVANPDQVPPFATAVIVELSITGDPSD